MIWETSTTISFAKRVMHIRYFVVSSAFCDDGSASCYGIGISDGKVTHTVQNFCPDKAEAVRVAELLCRMQVTPTTFFEVLEDYLATR